MARIAKVAIACAAVAAVSAFFFLAPWVPMREVTFELYGQHGWCFGEITSPPQTSEIYASASLPAMLHLGRSTYLLAVTSGGFRLHHTT